MGKPEGPYDFQIPRDYPLPNRGIHKIENVESDLMEEAEKIWQSFIDAGYKTVWLEQDKVSFSKYKVGQVDGRLRSIKNPEIRKRGLTILAESLKHGEKYDPAE